jgi:hypothetical protein
MTLKRFLTATVLSLTSIAAVVPAANAAMPAAPLVVDGTATKIQPVHGGIYWRYGRPYWNGYPGYRYPRPGYQYYGGFWFPPPAFGIIIIPRGGYGQPTYQLTERHYRWCERRYRSYRRWDNTFQPYHGPRKQCVSPYLYRTR